MTASLLRDAPYPKQDHSSVANLPLTFHASRFTVPESEARTPLADFFSILLSGQHPLHRSL